MSPSGPAGTRGRLLAHRPFRLFWTGRILSTSGFQIAGVVVGWKIYADTGSALALGFIGLAQFLPMLLLTFVVGHVADRFDRRRVAMTCQSHARPHTSP